MAKYCHLLFTLRNNLELLTCLTFGSYIAMFWMNIFRLHYHPAYKCAKPEGMRLGALQNQPLPVVSNG